MTHAVCLLIVLGVSTGALAQKARLENPIPLAALRVPIHGPSEQREAAAYGLWAAGPNFKASFHDGFVFHPAVGADREGRPMRWTTESIAVGSSPLGAGLGVPTRWHDAWRYEYRHPGFTEAYDVRADGVEQTFVVHERPLQAGDLVVTGRFETRLRARPLPSPAHAPLTFHDEDGCESARYGAAFVVDALGNRLPLTTAFDGERVQLSVPAGWLQSATFPITIDPLTSALAIAYGDTTALEVGREHESTSSNVMVFYTMRYARSDWDSFAFLCDNDFRNPWLVYASISATWNVFAGGLAYAGGSDRWVMSYARRDAAYATPMELGAEVHLRGDLQLNRGFTVQVPAAGGEAFEGSFAVGGTESGTKVLCAYVSTVGSTSTFWTRMLDSSALTLAAPQRVGPSRSSIGTTIAVSKTNTGSDLSWIVAYDSLVGTFPSLSYAVFVSRVDPSYVGPGNVVALGPPSTAFTTPCVDGRDGRYLVAATRGGAFGSVATCRIDWPQTASLPTLIGPFQVHDGFATSPTSVAYDHMTDSHWCVTWRIPGAGSKAARVGYQGGITEVVTLDPGVSTPVEWGPPSIAFQPLTGEFLIAHMSHATSPERLQGVRLLYPPEAVVTPYGTACGVAATFVSDRPYAGSEFFTMRAGGLPGLSPCALVLSGASAATPIGGGCFLNIGPIGLALPAIADARGAAHVTLKLPDVPLVQGDIYGQWAWAQGSALGTSRGLRVQIR